MVSINSTETAVDHLGLIARDIAVLRDTYVRLGFTVTKTVPVMQPGPNGKDEVSLGHVAAHVIFAENYLELAAVRHLGQGSHLDTWVERHEGLHILALRSLNAAESLNELITAGLIMPPLRAASFRVASGGASGIAHTKWFALPDSISREAFACVVEHETPELMFVPSLMTHANGARGLRAIFALVEDMDEAFARYRRLPGTRQRSFLVGRTIMMRDQQFVVLEPKGFNALFPGAQVPQPPNLGGYSLAVSDIAATRRVLEAAEVPFHPWGGTGIWVAPEHAGGAVVVFAEEHPPK